MGDIPVFAWVLAALFWLLVLWRRRRAMRATDLAAFASPVERHRSMTKGGGL